MLRHNSRNVFFFFFFFFFLIFKLGNIFESFDQKSQKIDFFLPKNHFLAFFVTFFKNIASFKNLKKKSS